MKISVKFGLVLLFMLMALSIGVAFGEKNTTVNNITPANEMSSNKVAVGSNTNITDANEVKEKEAADKNETTEDSVIIGSITYGKTNQWIEIKNNETSSQNLTDWKLEVQNKTVFTFPKFTLDANSIVQIHSGTGKNSKAALYAKNTLLTKADDEVSLLDANGNVVSTSEEPKETSDQPNDA